MHYTNGVAATESKLYLVIKCDILNFHIHQRTILKTQENGMMEFMLVSDED